MISPKVLHLATSLSGGAGIAARRIVEAQRIAGLESVLITNPSKNLILQGHEEVLTLSRSLKLLSKTNTFIQSNFLQKGQPLVTSYSIDLSDSIKEIIDLFEIVHIHAFYNFLNLKKIVEISKRRPVIVTLHDQRFFTGGCHYSLNCEGFAQDCRKCPQVFSLFSHIPKKILHESLNLFKEKQNISFISPSSWLSELASESSLLSNYEIHKFHNPIPEMFNPGLADDHHFEEPLKIGFVSQQLNNPYKGLDVLISAITYLAQSRKISLKLFGNGSIPRVSSEIDVVQAQYSSDEKAVSAIQSCDLIVVPSTQDNSPSVVSESLMCGVPVIGSHVGGIADVLDEFKMPSFPVGDSYRLFQILRDFDPFRIDKKTLEKIQKKFSYQQSARSHLELYKGILN